MRKGTPNVNCKYGRSPLPAHLLIVICWTIAHACLVDLQALLVTASLKGDGPTNYKLQASSFKLQAGKKDLTMIIGQYRMYLLTER